MSQALITLFRTAFSAQAVVAVTAPASAVRVVSASELRQVVGGTEAASPGRNW
jgi:hypothetical protein